MVEIVMMGSGIFTPIDWKVQLCKKGNQKERPYASRVVINIRSPGSCYRLVLRHCLGIVKG